MQLVEQHIIKRTNRYYTELDNLCYTAKNLYNATLYAVRQHFFNTDKCIKYSTIQKQFQDNNQADYRAIPTKVAQQTMRLVDQNFWAFFKALKSYKEKPDKFTGRPQIPKYLDIAKGRSVATFTNQAISYKEFKNSGKLKLTGVEYKIPTQIKNFHSIQQVRIVPRNGYCVVEVIYNVKEIALKPDNGNYAGIDLGVNNLAAVTSNTGNSFIINGRPLKSINQYYNKTKAKLQSDNKLPLSKLHKIELKRKNLIDNYLHKASRTVVNYLVSNNINTLVIGHNKGQKQNITNGSVNNQNFVQIPFNRFIQMLQYKCQFEGINVIITEESYTSKSSFFDNDILPVYKQESEEYVFSGKRIKRGLYRTGSKRIINADINGSLNIIRKVVPNIKIDGIEACSRPVVFTPQN